MVKSIKKPQSGREKFVQELRYLEQTQKFTTRERTKFSFQQRNFIRGIQITKGLEKRDAINEYKKIQGKKAKIKQVSQQIKARYDGRQDYTPTRRDRKLPAVKGKKVKTEYAYKGVTKEAPKSLKERFIQDKTSGSARRYIDKTTGENISRRERDKRIAEELTE